MLPQQIMCIFHPVVYCKLPIVMDKSSIFYVLAAQSPEFSIILVSIQLRASLTQHFRGYHFVLV